MSISGVEEGFKVPTHAVPHFLRNVKLSNGYVSPLYQSSSCCSFETAQAQTLWQVVQKSSIICLLPRPHPALEWFRANGNFQQHSRWGFREVGFLAILGKFPEKVNILEGPPARDEEIRASASLWAWTGSGAFWQWLGGQLKLGTPGAKACPPIIWAANCKTLASHRMAPLWENPALKLCSRFCFHECWILQSVLFPLTFMRQ